MCELMGLCFAKPVAADFSISAFSLRDEENADGWGLAWYAEHSVTVVKEPLPWRKSRYASFLETYKLLVSHMYIGHVRHATVGGAPKHADTHPFVRELAGRNYCFAHNGTVRGAFESLSLHRYHPVGETDSEHVFCHLLDEMARDARLLSNEDQWHWLAAKFAAINAMGKFNCLMSDGDRLFAWHDVNGFKGLHFHGVRMRGHEIEHLEDPSMEMEIESEEHNRGMIIATRPLSDVGWHAFQPGELQVIEEGRIVYSNLRSDARKEITAEAQRRKVHETADERG
jgi:predicted glutamine amidotransferase